jgi:mono/diheme cytochrome c family protein
MTRSGALAILVISLLFVLSPTTTATHAPESRTSGSAQASAREFVGTHCLACHNDRTRTAGLSLANADFDAVATQAELWEKVLHKVRTSQMPPPGRPQPDRSSRAGFASWLANALDRAHDGAATTTRVRIHRLNRTEYGNAIRDLFGLEVDTRSLLLPDEADEGFDNVAASLALSPAHLERYLAAARDISRNVVGDRTLNAAPASTTYRVPKLLEQDVRVSDDLPFGSRGGVAVRHHFPLDGDYVFRVRLRRQVYDYIVGMGHPQLLDIRVDGKRIKRFSVGGEATGTPGPLTWNGEIVGDTEWELYMHAADAGLEVRAPVSAGTHVISASFVDSPWEPEGVVQPLQVDFGRGSDEQYDGYAAVDALSVHGPYSAGASAPSTSARRAIFVCTPAAASEERPCASKILTALARRAYRRPATADEIATLLTFYDAGRKLHGFEGGIQSAIERMLVSFNFLFRIDQHPQFDLASRLSFFLWSSIPDDELLSLAANGRLSTPAVLEQQVRRMLRDRRSRALVDSFAAQWLAVRKASSALPDPNIFPEFDENLRAAFLEETSRFIDDQLRADRSIVELISADYSFLNERLAQHYGVANVLGERFRKVTFADGVRGGLLGQGSILLATSYPDRTTPVLRGVWVLDNLLGMPPPPPPPGIPDLEPKTPDGRLLSIREQLETHRANPACSVCHVRMDPLGFSLENFDAIGRWRTRSNGQPVDASATFADGTPIQGVAGLRTFLLQHREEYVHAFVSKLLTYALGRHLDYRDAPVVRRIAREAAADDARWSAIVVGIVKSPAFLGRPDAAGRGRTARRQE